MNDTPPIIRIILVLLLCLVIKYLANKLSDKFGNSEARKRNAETPDTESRLSDRYNKR